MEEEEKRRKKIIAMEQSAWTCFLHKEEGHDISEVTKQPVWLDWSPPMSNQLSVLEVKRFPALWAFRENFQRLMFAPERFDNTGCSLNTEQQWSKKKKNYQNQPVTNSPRIYLK